VDKKRLEGVEQRLFEVNEIIQKVDPSIRASAFELFKGYVLLGGALTQPHEPPENSAQYSAQPAGLSEMVQAHAHDKPSDNAHLLAAVWYQQYGSSPFELSAIKERAEAAGLTIPDRLNMTLTAAQDEGKKLYQSAGRGLYKPTVAGELYLKKKYGVTKGTAIPPSARES
jgi:hypothetical protein